MAYLCEKKETLEIVRKYGLRAQKKYGQNFLTDRTVIEKLIHAAGVDQNDTVLEIGPGIGTMTQLLAESAGHVVAVEIDVKLREILTDTLSDYDNVEIIYDDILKTDIAAIADKYAGYENTALCSTGSHSYYKLKVTANLPYYITTPILMALLSDSGIRGRLSGITVMVQKEVADRMEAVPGSKDYGALSLAIQYYTEPHTVCIVPPSAFIPPPSVHSAVIHLALRDTPPAAIAPVDESHLFRVIRAAFGTRRKTLPNALTAADAVSDRDTVVKALEAMGLSPTVRGEALTLEQFAKLTSLMTR